MSLQVRGLTLALAFTSWKAYLYQVTVAALRTEVNRLTGVVGRYGDSIWAMRKEQLVQVAYRELGMSEYHANKETVLTLREKIRAARDEREPPTTQQNEGEGEIGKPPKGLQKMTVKELIAECIKRGIDYGCTGERGRTNKTRAQMVMLITEHAEAHAAPTPGATSATRTRSASVKRRAPQDDPMQI